MTKKIRKDVKCKRLKLKPYQISRTEANDQIGYEEAEKKWNIVSITI